MSRRGVVALIAVFVVVSVVVGFTRSDPGQFILSGFSFTRSVDTDRGTYFRLKVKLAYKGEPQDFDIVVGCNVRVTIYKDNSSTYEAGLVPTVFGRRMSDGAAVVVRPPDACRGQTTANGKVPEEFIPLIIVYDDANTLGFGTAYVTEDAYDSPLAVLKFGGATIEAATGAEFAAFRAEQPNIVRPEQYFADSPAELEKRGLSQPSVPLGDDCFGFARFRMVEQQRNAALRHWPLSRPRYWRVDGDTANEVYGSSPMTDLAVTDSPSAKSHLRHQFMLGLENADFGVPIKSGRGLILLPDVLPASVYPDIGGWIALPWPERPEERAVEILTDGPRVGASIDYRNGATKGFAYCRSRPERFANTPGSRASATLAKYNTMTGVDLVGGVAVAAAQWRGRAWLVIENDEFMFRGFSISLNSTRGDV